MIVARTVPHVREMLTEHRRAGRRTGLVPTMGALHAGHRALLRAARERSHVVVMSLFVNPTQFDEAGDLARYPQDEEADLAVADREGVDVVFAPSVDALYPSGFDTWVDPGELATILEGAARPGHFRGVATVCTKLFTIVAPDLAFFGQKDAQQVAVIRQVIRDLDLAVEIVTVPTVRDPDGLPVSSRNVFLSASQRMTALALPRALEAGLAAHRAGADPVAAARATLEAEPGLSVDYVAIAPFVVPTLVAATRVGSVRLIDNIPLEAR